MNILVVNDDGWGTAGIRLLAREMTKLGKVTVVAPDGARSGFGACLTTGKGLFLQRIDERDLNGAEVYITNGTPADCVKLARDVLFRDGKIDLVVSGINHGTNVGINTIYSGTMGACFCAAEHDIPAIGWSINSHAMDVDLHWLQPMLAEVTQHLIDEGFAPRMCYNINAPVGEIEGIQWTRQGRCHWEKEMEPGAPSRQTGGVASAEEGSAPITNQQSPITNQLYYLAGVFVNDEPEAQDTDLWAVDHQKIAITPCSIDFTYYEAL